MKKRIFKIILSCLVLTLIYFLLDINDLPASIGTVSYTHLDVYKRQVLYLALEDDFQRIQSRMFMMYGVNDTPNLHFATAAGKIGNGLDEQLKNFVQEHPDTNLIIIDTMQKIREVGGEAYSYASDYEIIGRIKQFADQHGICVLTVHHTRKQQADDSFETISGTTGLLGCADGSLLMQKKKRTELDATIKVVGVDWLSIRTGRSHPNGNGLQRPH